jgi:two-component system, NarL family, nitrate/nitrite response regulator NarL
MDRDLTAKIVLIEDHGLIAHTLSAALSARGANVTNIDPAANDDLIAAVLGENADLALLDLDLGPQGDATRFIEPLRTAGVRVLMVTGVDDPVRRAACVRAGAAGVVSKSASFDELTAAVEQVLETGTLLSKSERDEMLAVLRRHEADERERLAPFERLSGREAEVLGLLMLGRTVEQVARERFVSVPTVRTQVRSILSKLDAASQVVAIARAREAGWVPPQER